MHIGQEKLVYNSIKVLVLHVPGEGGKVREAPRPLSSLTRKGVVGF